MSYADPSPKFRRRVEKLGIDEAQRLQEVERQKPKSSPDVRPDAGEFRMTLRLPKDAAAALAKLAPRGERCDLIAYLLRCELRRQMFEANDMEQRRRALITRRSA